MVFILLLYVTEFVSINRPESGRQNNTRKEIIEKEIQVGLV